MTPPRPPMACREAIERLWALLDGELDEVDRVALDRHLTWCRRCCGELVFARHLRAMLREQPPLGMPSGTRARLESFIDELCEPSGEVS